MLRRMFLGIVGAVAGLFVVAKPAEAKPKIDSFTDWWDWLDYQFHNNTEYRSNLDHAASSILIPHVFAGRLGFSRADGELELLSVAWQAVRELLHYGNVFIMPHGGCVKRFSPRDIRLLFDPYTDKVEIVLELQDRDRNQDMADYSIVLNDDAVHVQLKEQAIGFRQQGWVTPMWIPGQPVPTQAQMHEVLLRGHGLQKIKAVVDRAWWQQFGC